MSHKNSSFVLIMVSTMFAVISCRKDEIKPPASLNDVEGNIYKTVMIGTQIWMAENLKTTRYSDGTDIPLLSDGAAWRNLTTPGFCWYGNDANANKNTYGALYNGYTINTGKLCPAGWHVPSRAEWQELRDFAGDTLVGGGRLKEAGTVHWSAPNKGADNSLFFSALAGGFRYFDGSFASILNYTGFWSSTVTGVKDEWFAGFYYGDASFTIDHMNKTYGFSVRCVKDH